MRDRLDSGGLHYYLMAVLILLVGLFQVTAAARISLAGVKPDLALLLVIVWTLLYGSRGGVIWAFVAGVWLDVFSNGPMGATSLGYMTASLFVGLGQRTLSRYNLLVPLAATVGATVIYSLLYLFLLEGLALVTGTLGLMVPDYRLPLQETLRNVVVPLVVYNTTLMLMMVPLLNRIPAGASLPRSLDE